MNKTEDPKYLAFIATRPCLICVRPYGQVHHQNQRYHGSKSLKASDYRTLPLCVDHHTGDGTLHQPGSYHKNGWKFWDMYQIDVETVIANFNLAYFFALSVRYIEQ